MKASKLEVLAAFAVVAANGVVALALYGLAVWM